MKSNKRSTKWILAATALLIIVIGGMQYVRGHTGDDPAAQVALLISDQIGEDDPLVQIWVDAAREEGMNLRVVSASAYVRSMLLGRGKRFAGLILPDSVVQTASKPFMERLRGDVADGASLMLVYDAATKDMAGNFYPGNAPLSDLVGVSYARYDALRAGVTATDLVVGTPEVMAALDIPPGKTIDAGKSEDSRPLRALAGYQYGSLKYPSFVTNGQFHGRHLLSSPSGSVVAGTHDSGKGRVLFVNLPLGYLKGHTDGLPLHAFLRYFYLRMLQLPALSAAPDAVGGLVFNWHVDSNAAIPAIQRLDDSGILSEGPFSIHFTAGPDARRFGDQLGLDLEHNAIMRNWVARFKQRGDVLGNHGGWIHDYFGLNVNEENRAQMEKYLEMNDHVVSALNGAPVREYSAPVGTQPKWVTRWLENHGYVAYYFMGNGGLGPTRSYRDGRLYTPKIWSFPVLTFGTIASFEEATDLDVSESAMTEWLQEVSDFVSDRGLIRMVYSHPPGFSRYPATMRDWFAHVRMLRAQDRFRWYTMTQVADFLNRRELTQWRMEADAQGYVIDATHPTSLEHLAWTMSKSRFAKPQVESGVANIEESSAEWRVVAGKGNRLRIRCTFIPSVLKG